MGDRTLTSAQQGAARVTRPCVQGTAPPYAPTRPLRGMVKGSARLSVLTVALILVLRDQGRSFRAIVANRRVRKKDGTKVSQQGARHVVESHKLPRQTWKSWTPNGAGLCSVVARMRLRTVAQGRNRPSIPILRMVTVTHASVPGKATSRGRSPVLPPRTVKRVEAAIVKYRFTTAVRAPWLKKQLKLRCHVSTVIDGSASNGICVRRASEPQRV